MSAVPASSPADATLQQILQYSCVRQSFADQPEHGVVLPGELLLPEDQAAGTVTVRFASTHERVFSVHELEVIDEAVVATIPSLQRLRSLVQDEVQRSSDVVHAKRLQRHAGGFEGATYLHERVPADRWGITRDVWDDFMAVVAEKWRTGELQNTGTGEHAYAEEKFRDPAVGPSMYQINEQVIEPVTADASLVCPGVSWSLRRSLVGAKVTQFVSHAWGEGVFDFDRSLRAAWSGDDAMYICFLSNPQNLRELIARMLATIEISPFRVALQHLPPGGKLILVANQNVPIHTRWWCVYELYVASENQIPIVLVGQPLDLANRRGEANAAMEIIRVDFYAINEPITEYGKLYGGGIDICCMSCRRNPDPQGTCAEVRYVLSLCGLRLWGLVLVLFAGFVLIAILPIPWHSWKGIYLASLPCSLGVACVWSCFFPPLSERFGQKRAAIRGKFMDVREADCHQADKNNILKQIKGKERKLNSIIGRLILVAAPKGS